jgi:choline dehydrogenase
MPQPSSAAADLTGFSPDVIVIGSGSGGAPATRRLVDQGDLRVLLLEAGDRDVNPAIHDPGRVHELWLSECDWAFETVPQRHASDRRLAWPRGKVLGGSSCLNGMVWVRGAREDYDTWAYLGAEGWAWDDVRPVFERIERRDPASGSGMVTITADFEPDAIHAALVAAAAECGIEPNPDYNGGHQDGVSYMELSIRDGARDSVVKAYLDGVAEHPNLRVLTGAHVTRLETDGTRVIGVEWSGQNGIERAHCGEVILSAGTIGSPQVLMLSGIGPADHLAEHGIDVVCDLPGVGENLHDHVLSPVIFSAERQVGPPSPGLPACQTHLFWRSRPGLNVPDVQPIHFMVPLYEPWMEGPENGFSLMAGMIHPLSRGTIRLSGPSPDDPLLIDPNVLAVEADLESLLAAIDLCRRMGRTDALRDWGVEERYPGAAVSTEADVARYARDTAITYHHQVGTCRMGRDARAVVDPKLRVHGIDGLRVADASVMPSVPTGNTQAPSIMIGERVADFVVQS